MIPVVMSWLTLTAVLAGLEMVIDGDFGALNDGQRQVLGDAEAKSEDLLGLIEEDEPF